MVLWGGDHEYDDEDYVPPTPDEDGDGDDYDPDEEGDEDEYDLFDPMTLFKYYD